MPHHDKEENTTGSMSPHAMSFVIRADLSRHHRPGCKGVLRLERLGPPYAPGRKHRHQRRQGHCSGPQRQPRKWCGYNLASQSRL